ncbi:MAG: hypothetical protein WBF52_02225, partial [Geitlerinemataceae cyanobacterium]
MGLWVMNAASIYIVVTFEKCRSSISRQLKKETKKALPFVSNMTYATTPDTGATTGGLPLQSTIYG